MEGGTKSQPGVTSVMQRQTTISMYSSSQLGRSSTSCRREDTSEPLALEAASGKAGTPFGVAILSASSANQVPTDWREDLWDMLRQTSESRWMLLTKSPAEHREDASADWPPAKVAMA